MTDRPSDGSIPPASGLIPAYSPGSNRRSLWLVATAVIAAGVTAPLVGLGIYASRGSGDLWPHLVASILPAAAGRTLMLLAGVGCVVTILGLGLAWLVAMYRFPGRRLFEWALLLPLSVPSYIVAYAYLDVLHPVGPVQSGLRALFGISNPRDLPFPEIRSLPGAILLLGFVLYPYVYLPLRALFLTQSPGLLDVARTLGRSERQVFIEVALPLARPALAVGCSLALLEALNDIGASEFLGVRTLTVAVYTTWVTRSSIEGAAQIALVMLALVALFLAVERWGRRMQRYAGRGRVTPPALKRLTGGKAVLATLAAALPVLLGFGVPAGYLVWHAGLRYVERGLPEGLSGWSLNTLAAAGGATVVTLVVGTVVGYAGRLHRGRWAALLTRICSLGYAVPGTVLAAGLLMPVAALDNMIANLLRAVTGERFGLLLSSTGMALVIAYVIRFLAVAAGGVEAGLTRITPSLDMAARSLGAGPGRVVRRIHLPLIRPSLAAAGLLVFVDCMKELPLTLLLRPLNFETLATTVYGEAARGTYEDGAIAALAIVLVGLAPVVLLARSQFAGRAAPGSGR